MATDILEMETIIPATAEDIFNAWLDAETHAAFTGSEATGSAEVGSPFTAWDGYIRGTTVALEDGHRIVQNWRTTEFADDHPDSRLEVILTDNPEGGTLLTLIHTEIPYGQGESYRQGWIEYYFEPLLKYFGGAARDDVKKAAAPKKAAPKKAAPKKAAPKKAAPKKAAAKKAPVKKAAKKAKAAPKKKAKAAPKKKHAAKKKAPAKKKGKKGARR